LPVVGAVPALAEGTAGVEPAGKAERAMAAREVERSPREPSHEDVLSTWEGPGPWDPGGKSPKEHTFDSKRPVETKRDAVGIDARNKPTRKTWPPDEPVRNGTHNHEQSTTHLLPILHRPIPSSRRRPVFVLRLVQRAWRRPGRCRGRGVATKHRPRPFGGRHTRITPSSRASPCPLNSEFASHRHRHSLSACPHHVCT